MTRSRAVALGVATALVSTAVAYGVRTTRPASAATSTIATLSPLQQTSRADLDRSAAIARQRLAANPADTTAAVRLADILLRQARVDAKPQHAIDAEQVLEAALDHEPSDYTALKLLGAVYLSQHRFRDAIAVAERSLRVRDDDAWTHGVLGDAWLELGEYDRAFDAYDRMASLRPDAASYGRIAHAQELQGRLDDALKHMRMAAEGTGTHDPESQAWHYAQIGNLYFEMGDIDSASREYHRANYTFPNHPYARHGLARVAAARGDAARSLQLYRELLSEAPTPELTSAVGDLLSASGDAAGAREMYARAEQLERDGWETEEPQPAALARMLAERDLKRDEAVTLAERAAKDRSDINTMDALAIAYYRAGRLPEARAASARARRTGSADRRILYHAALIEHAIGDQAAARALVDRAIDGHTTFDPLIAPAALALARQLAIDRTGSDPVPSAARANPR